MTTGDVTVWHLALRDPAGLVPASVADVEVSVEPDPAVSRALYDEVGAAHGWVDRHGRDLDWWRERLAGGTVLTAHVDGELAGWAELMPVADGEVELTLLGVRERARGRGVGGHLLTAAVQHAFADGAAAVLLETCSLDGPAALPNYQRRGFVVERVVEERRALRRAA